MSKCPFWSTNKERVNCYNECPMNPVKNNDEICPFTEHLVAEKISFKDIMQSDYQYSQEEEFDTLLSNYMKNK